MNTFTLGLKLITLMAYSKLLKFVRYLLGV